MSMVKWPNVPKLIMVQPLLALGIVSQDQKRKMKPKRQISHFQLRKKKKKKTKPKQKLSKS